MKRNALIVGVNVLLLVLGVATLVSASGSVFTDIVWTLPYGASSAKYSSLGTTEDEHAVKASSGVLLSVTITNTNAAARYLRCADATAAGTTPGTTTPVIDLAVPGNTAGSGFTVALPGGMTFTTALTCWFVTGAASTDVTEVAANEIKAFYTYR